MVIKRRLYTFYHPFSYYIILKNETSHLLPTTLEIFGWQKSATLGFATFVPRKAGKSGGKFAIIWQRSTRTRRENFLRVDNIRLAICDKGKRENFGENSWTEENLLVFPCCLGKCIHVWLELEKASIAINSGKVLTTTTFLSLFDFCECFCQKFKTKLKMYFNVNIRLWIT